MDENVEDEVKMGEQTEETEESLEPTADLSPQSAEKSTIEPALELAAETTMDPVAELAAESLAESSSDSLSKSLVKPTVEQATEPVTEPATEPVTEPATGPVIELVSEPVTEPVDSTTEPTNEPTNEPTTEPTISIGEEAKQSEEKQNFFQRDDVNGEGNNNHTDNGQDSDKSANGVNAQKDEKNNNSNGIEKKNAGEKVEGDSTHQQEAATNPVKNSHRSPNPKKVQGADGGSNPATPEDSLDDELVKITNDVNGSHSSTLPTSLSQDSLSVSESTISPRGFPKDQKAVFALSTPAAKGPKKQRKSRLGRSPKQQSPKQPSTSIGMSALRSTSKAKRPPSATKDTTARTKTRRTSSPPLPSQTSQETADESTQRAAPTAMNASDSSIDNSQQADEGPILHTFQVHFWRPKASNKVARNTPENGKLKLTAQTLTYRSIRGKQVQWMLKDITVNRARHKRGGISVDAIRIIVSGGADGDEHEGKTEAEEEFGDSNSLISDLYNASGDPDDSMENEKDFFFTMKLKGREEVMNKIQLAIDAVSPPGEKDLEKREKEKMNAAAAELAKKKKTFRAPPPDPILAKMETVLSEKITGVSIENYYNTAWSEGEDSTLAPLYGPWLTSCNMLNVKVPPWETATNNNISGDWCKEKYSQKRVVTYNYLKLSIGSNKTHVQQTQRCRRSEDQCVMHMTVSSKGFSYADCFVVEIRHVASRTLEDEITVSIGLHINFFRPSMMERKLRTSVAAETVKSQTDLFQHIKKACLEPLEKKLEEEADSTEVDEAAPADDITEKSADTGEKAEKDIEEKDKNGNEAEAKELNEEETEQQPSEAKEEEHDEKAVATTESAEKNVNDEVDEEGIEDSKKETMKAKASPTDHPHEADSVTSEKLSCPLDEQTNLTTENIEPPLDKICDEVVGTEALSKQIISTPVKHECLDNDATNNDEEEVGCWFPESLRKLFGSKPPPVTPLLPDPNVDMLGSICGVKNEIKKISLACSAAQNDEILSEIRAIEKSLDKIAALSSSPSRPMNES